MPGVEPFPFLEAGNGTTNQLADIKEDTRFVAAIDVGTNSIHLVVASVRPALHTFSIETAEKSTTRLGESDLDSGDLTDDAMQRALSTIRRFKDLAESYQVEELIIAATSAVREASNGLFFLNKIKEELGLDADLISGAEEARMIYLGVFGHAF